MSISIIYCDSNLLKNLHPLPSWTKLVVSLLLRPTVVEYQYQHQLYGTEISWKICTHFLLHTVLHKLRLCFITIYATTISSKIFPSVQNVAQTRIVFHINICDSSKIFPTVQNVAKTCIVASSGSIFPPNLFGNEDEHWLQSKTHFSARLSTSNVDFGTNPFHSAAHSKNQKRSIH